MSFQAEQSPSLSGHPTSTVHLTLPVVLVNAAIGYVEESRARSALDALARSMTQEALVVREGDEHRIEARELVPGDLVLVRSGDKVPADLRLVRSRALRVDESALTGECVAAPQDRAVVAVADGKVDRAGRPWHQRDHRRLVALADDLQGTRSTPRRRCRLADVAANHARNPRDGGPSSPTVRASWLGAILTSSRP